jgi:integrase/recombinase XerD
MIQAPIAHRARIDQLREHLIVNRYAVSMQRQYIFLANRFVDYLDDKGMAIEAVRRDDIDDFLQWELRSWRKRFRRSPSDLTNWRKRYKTAVQALLRLVHGHWPIEAEPTTAIESFHRDIVNGYDSWMNRLRGLSQTTRAKRVSQALEFLTALGPNGAREGIKRLTVSQLDSYIVQHCKNLKRATIEDYTVCLRSFLRYLYGRDLTVADMSSSVIGPRIYDNEQIPVALPQAFLEGLLDVTRMDASPLGIRDYAFLTLLATYGFRAGELMALRLEHVDWRRDTILVRHSKTDSYSEVPLLPVPGDAILGYLEKARPTSEHRELFLHVRAPYGPYKSGGILNHVINARLEEAGFTPPGRRGPHAIRHARAVSLLRASVPLKTIGDILGHRSAESISAYLKLATEPLRAVCLELPEGVLPL